MSNRDDLQSTSLDELRQLAASSADSGQLDQAIEYYEMALPLSQSAQDAQAEVEILKALGVLYQRVGQPQQAISYLSKGLTLARKNERTQPLRVAEYLHALADCEEAEHNPAGAAEHLREAITIYESQHHPLTEQVELTLRLADLYTQSGDELTASIPYQQAVAKAQQAGSIDLEVQGLFGLGVVCLNQNQLDNARHYLELALTTASKGGSSNLLAQVLHQLGVVYLVMSRRGDAAFTFQRALQYVEDAALRAEIKARLESTYPAIAGNATIKDIEKQLAEAQQSNLSLAPALLAELAARYLEQGQFPKVVESYDNAVALSQELGDRHAEMTWLTHLGNFYAGHFESYKALQAYEAALIISRETGDRLLEGQLLLNLGLTYADQERMVDAKKLIKESISLFQQSGEADLAAQAREYLDQLG